MEGHNPIKITQVKDPVFREKHEPKIEVKETAFSDEQENTKNTDGEKGEKFLTLINKDNQETIGNLFYDYPKEGNNNEILKVRFAGIEDKYKGQASRPLFSKDPFFCFQNTSSGSQFLHCDTTARLYSPQGNV